MPDSYQTLYDLVGQTIAIFVPAIGMTQGAVQAVNEGDPRGVLKVFIPGIGIGEAAVNATGDGFELLADAGMGPLGQSLWDKMLNAIKATGLAGLAVGGVVVGVGYLALRERR